MHITKPGHALWVIILIIMIIMISATSYMKSLNVYRSVVSSYSSMWKNHYIGELCLAIIEAHILDNIARNSYQHSIDDKLYAMTWDTQSKKNHNITKYTITQDGVLWAEGIITCIKDNQQWQVQKSTIQYVRHS